MASEPHPALAQGLSDFCSNPDTYVLNLTQEETGLSSGAWTCVGVGEVSGLGLGWWRGWAWGGARTALLTASPAVPPTSDILNYYFLCNQAVSNPFQQVRAGPGEAGGGGPGVGPLSSDHPVVPVLSFHRG